MKPSSSRLDFLILFFTLLFGKSLDVFGIPLAVFSYLLFSTEMPTPKYSNQPRLMRHSFKIRTIYLYFVLFLSHWNQLNFYISAIFTLGFSKIFNFTNGLFWSDIRFFSEICKTKITQPFDGVILISCGK